MVSFGGLKNKLSTSEVQLITKETQKTILKVICEFPTLSIEEIPVHLKNMGKSISHEEVIQTLLSIAPNRNWHRTSREEATKEILDYLWTLEAQILFLLPTKQKETTLAEFNQLRLRNKQPKVSKDLIRHLQSLLSIEGKNLARFRKFEKDLSILDDVDPTTQALWMMRVIFSSIDPASISSTNELSNLLVEKLKEKSPALSEKVGKTIQRGVEKFIERYFLKDISNTNLRELLLKYQTIYRNGKKGTDDEIIIEKEFQDQNKLIQNAIDDLTNIQNLVTESHEGGFVGKLLSGKVKNKEGIVEKAQGAIEALNELLELNNIVNKASSEKALVIQKLQSDYENIVLLKSQLENDLSSLKDELKLIQEKKINIENELNDKNESLEKAHEKIAVLQQTVDKIPENENKEKMLREELNTAKDISLRLHGRVVKLKEDLKRLYAEKLTVEKTNSIQKPISKPNGESLPEVHTEIISQPQSGEIQ